MNDKINNDINNKIDDKIRKCSSCKVNVYSQHSVCPLCGKQLGLQVKTETAYPKYEVNWYNTRFTLENIILFVAVLASAVSIFINVFTIDFNSKLALWSVIVSASFVSMWLIIHIILKKTINVGRKIFYNYATVSIYMIVLDVFSGFYKWSTTYVIPFLTIFVAVVFTAIAVSSNRNFRDYVGSLIVIFFISICPILIYIFSLSTQAWTSFIAVLYCLLTVAGLFIFSGANFKKEIKKRFHF